MNSFDMGGGCLNLLSSRSLRSKYSYILCSPRFKLKTSYFVKASVNVASPAVWDSLPLSLRSI